MLLDPADFDYQLPTELIANKPSRHRDSCRLLMVDRQTQVLSHHHFSDVLEMLGPGDVLVLNQSKVFPARIYGHKSTGGKVELLLLNTVSSYVWRCLFKPSPKPNTKIVFSDKLVGTVTKDKSIEFNLPKRKVLSILNKIGTTPTPPYIKTVADELTVRKQYQTVYAKQIGSAAAPTAGLHFTKSLLSKLEKKGVQIEYVTLHVGLGTFQSLRPENLETKTLHHESYDIEPEVANRLNMAKKQGKRIIAIGTTSVRTMESAVDHSGNLSKLSGSTNIFIYPGVKFKFVDSMITNFHLPKSSLLMLVTAISSSDLIKKAYSEAISHRYRFFSFGDAMWIV